MQQERDFLSRASKADGLKQDPTPQRSITSECLLKKESGQNIVVDKRVEIDSSKIDGTANCYFRCTTDSRDLLHSDASVRRYPSVNTASGSKSLSSTLNTSCTLSIKDAVDIYPGHATDKNLIQCKDVCHFKENRNRKDEILKQDELITYNAQNPATEVRSHRESDIVGSKRQRSSSPDYTHSKRARTMEVNDVSDLPEIKIVGCSTMHNNSTEDPIQNSKSETLLPDNQKKLSRPAFDLDVEEPYSSIFTFKENTFTFGNGRHNNSVKGFDTRRLGPHAKLTDELCKKRNWALAIHYMSLPSINSNILSDLDPYIVYTSNTLRHEMIFRESIEFLRMSETGNTDLDHIAQNRDHYWTRMQTDVGIYLDLVKMSPTTLTDKQKDSKFWIQCKLLAVIKDIGVILEEMHPIGGSADEDEKLAEGLLDNDGMEKSDILDSDCRLLNMFRVQYNLASIWQELESGKFDLFSYLKSILDVAATQMTVQHDQFAPKILDYSKNGDVVGALILTLHFLEQIKKDIINCHIKQFRPHCLQNAITWEREWFRKQVKDGQFSLIETVLWLGGSCERLQSANSQLSFKEVYHQAISNFITVPNINEESPETFVLDLSRLCEYQTNFQELSALAVCMCLLRQFTYPHCEKIPGGLVQYKKNLTVLIQDEHTTSEDIHLYLLHVIQEVRQNYGKSFQTKPVTEVESSFLKRSVDATFEVQDKETSIVSVMRSRLRKVVLDYLNKGHSESKMKHAVLLKKQLCGEFTSVFQPTLFSNGLQESHFESATLLKNHQNFVEQSVDLALECLTINRDYLESLSLYIVRDEIAIFCALVGQLATHNLNVFSPFYDCIISHFYKETVYTPEMDADKGEERYEDFAEILCKTCCLEDESDL